MYKVSTPSWGAFVTIPGARLTYAWSFFSFDARW
jgi:hypothetical protein